MHVIIFLKIQARSHPAMSSNDVNILKLRTKLGSEMTKFASPHSIGRRMHRVAPYGDVAWG